MDSQFDKILSDSTKRAAMWQRLAGWRPLASPMVVQMEAKVAYRLLQVVLHPLPEDHCCFPLLQECHLIQWHGTLPSPLHDPQILPTSTNTALSNESILAARLEPIMLLKLPIICFRAITMLYFFPYYALIMLYFSLDHCYLNPFQSS